MKKLLLGFLVFLVAISVFAEDGIIDARRKALDNSISDVILQMNSQIQVAKSQSLDFQKLIDIKTKTQLIVDSLANATSKEDLDGKIEQLRESVLEFKAAAKDIGMGAYRQKSDSDIEKRRSERNNESKRFSDEALEARRVAILRSFDMHIERVQNAINKTKDRNISTTEIEQKLADLVALKPSVVSAINSGDKVKIREIMQQINDKWKEIQMAFDHAYGIGHRKKILDKAEELLAKIDRNLELLKKGSKDNDEIKQKREALKKSIEDLRKSLDSDNQVSQQSAVESVNNAFSKFKETYDVVRA